MTLLTASARQALELIESCGDKGCSGITLFMHALDGGPVRELLDTGFVVRVNEADRLYLVVTRASTAIGAEFQVAPSVTPEPLPPSATAAGPGTPRSP